MIVTTYLAVLLSLLTLGFSPSAAAASAPPQAPYLCPEGADCASTASGGPVSAGTYFVDSNARCGSDCDGRSVATAWKSVRDVGRLADGADVCLMEGSVFEDTEWEIRWSGSAQNRAVLGTCYQQAGNTYWWWEGPSARQRAKAEINGTFEPACIAAGRAKCDPSSDPGHVPVSEYGGLVEVTGSYVTLRAFKLRDSAAKGIVFNGKPGQTRNHLVDLDVQNLYGSNFFHLGSAPSTRHIVRNNYFRNAGYAWSVAWYGNRGRVGGACFQFSRGTHIDKSQPAYNIMEGNVLGNCSGEVGFLDSSHHIIRGNVFYNTRNTGIYLDNVAHSVVEWNITFLARDDCSVDPRFGGPNGCGPNESGSSHQGGARWAMEDYPAGCDTLEKCRRGTTDSTDNVVRHNLYVWGEQGWSTTNETFAGQNPDLMLGKYFTHNTIWYTTLDPYRERISANADLQMGTQVVGNVFIGNPAFDTDDSTCQSSHDAPYYAMNGWGETRAQLMDACKGKDDQYGIDPRFAGSLPRSQPPLVAQRPTFADFSIAGGDGDRVSALQQYDNEVLDVIDANCSQFPQLEDLEPMHGAEISWKPTCDNWRKKAYYNYLGQPRASDSDLGF